MTETLLRGRALPVLLAIFAIVFVDNVDVSALSVALPVIADEFGVSVGGVQWLMSVYFVSSASFFLLAGYLGDRFGIRDTLIAGVALIVLSSALGGFSSSLAGLVLWRFVQGVGYALTFSMTMLLTKDLLPEGRRDLGMGVFMGVATLSSMAGPLVGSAMTEVLGWRSLFFVNVVLCAPCLVALARNLRGRPALVHGSGGAGGDSGAAQGRLSAALGAQVLLALGLLGATTGLLLLGDGQTQGGLGREAMRGALVAALVGAASFVGFGLARRHLPERARGRGARAIVENRPFMAVLSVRVVLQAVSYSSFFWLPIVLQRGLGYGLVDAGLILTAFTAAAAVSAFAAGALASRVGRRAVSVGGHALLVMGLFALASGGLSSSTWVLVLCLVAIGAGFSAAFTVVSAALLRAVDGGPEGRLIGVYYTCSYIAGSLAIAATTWIGGGSLAGSGGGGAAAYLGVSETLAWLWLAGAGLSLGLSLILREPTSASTSTSTSTSTATSVAPQPE